MNSTIVRIGKGLIVHLLFVAIAIGIVWLMVSTFDDASQSLRDQFTDAADNGESVMSYLADARGNLIEWAVASLASCWLISAMFVSMAGRQAPRGYEDSTAMKSLWWGLFVAMIIACGGLLWFQVIATDVVLNVESGSLWVCLIAVALLVLLGYFIATAWGVKLTMKRSVPLSGLIPDGGN